MLKRYSSRFNKLTKTFLNEKLNNAIAYDRIAGYFSSSIIEVAGEAIEKINGKIRIVCNSKLSKKDFMTIKSAYNALWKEWCKNKPEEKYITCKDRLKKLYELIVTKKLEIKIIPDDVYGLMHGKAGVITLKDGSKTSFIGSVNETNGWEINYEILWEDDSIESVRWVEEEFNFFWNNQYAYEIPQTIIDDIKRISERTVCKLDEFKNELKPESALIESPIYRKELGLWEHQKYFINLVFTMHQKPCGARYILADTVGLGKTIQLALSAQLIALISEKPILIIVPKSLIYQWQTELKELLGIPSAIWTGKEWVDENGMVYPKNNILKCPRRIGIISSGLITAKSKIVEQLLDVEYECVIVDEAHKARRTRYNNEYNEIEKITNKPSLQNNLMQFLMKISKNTKSMLLATATPIQLHPIEAFDLLEILAQKNYSVLGNEYSNWRGYFNSAINIISGNFSQIEEYEIFDWLFNPFPIINKSNIDEYDEIEHDLASIRRRVWLNDNEYVLTSTKKQELENRPGGYELLKKVCTFKTLSLYNPFITHIIRRTREFLEETINPITNEPYFPKINVKLNDIKVTTTSKYYLDKAYELAEEFCKSLNNRLKGKAFLKVLLLKRLGSTIIAGINTASNILNNWQTIYEDYEKVEIDLDNELTYESDDIDFELELEDNQNKKEKTDDINNKTLTYEEKELLNNFINCLKNIDSDPKYKKVLEILNKDNLIERGCIIFSQYYDSAKFIAENLSKDLNQKIGLYAGGNKSGIYINGEFQPINKEILKEMVTTYQLSILVGTDAASEGLNLQTLGSLINLDLPWNPTRLEQRKGRIYRIGQKYDEIYIYNLMYVNSIEDRVYEVLKERLDNISKIFGQIPDLLEEVWIYIALNEMSKAKALINSIPTQHPFELKYNQLQKINWEHCSKVLDNNDSIKILLTPWKN